MSNERIPISIIDKTTYELYYANKECFEFCSSSMCDYKGKKCFEALRKKDSVCKDCKIKELGLGKLLEITSRSLSQKKMALYVDEINWEGKPSYLLYGVDKISSEKEQEYLDSERERDRLIFDKSGIAFMDYDFITKKYAFNKAFKKYALSKEKSLNIMNNNADLSTVNSKDLPFLKNFLNELSKEEGYARVTLRMKMIDGTYRWSKLSGYIVRDNDKKPTRAIGTIEDVNDQHLKFIKQLETYTAEYEQNLVANKSLRSRCIFDLTTNTVIDYYSIDSDGKKLTGNPSINDFILHMMKGISGINQLDKKTINYSLSALLKAYEKGEEVVHKMELVKDGKPLIYSSVTHFAKNPYTGDATAFVYVFDVTREEIGKRINEIFVQKVFEFMALVNCTNRRIDYCLTREGIPAHPSEGLDYDTAMQNDFKGVVPEEDYKEIVKENLYDTVVKALNEKDDYSCTMNFISNGKTYRKLLRFSWFDKYHSRILFTRTDITEVYMKEKEIEKELNNALAQAQSANKAKTEFLSRMSHDMRTPMNAIIGFAELAADEKGLSPVVTDYLRKIDSSGQYLLGLINDVLDMAKIENKSFELHEEVVYGPTFLNDIADVFEARASAKGIKLVTDFTKSQTPWVKMDQLRSRQIYSNLLDNAIKFSPSGTVIKWTMEDKIVSPNVMKMVCVIQDQGCGMSKEFMNKLFLPFEQEDNAFSPYVTGTGLGLSIVKRFVDLMGGTISVESELNKGTKFTVHLTRKLGEPIEKIPSVKSQEDYSYLIGKRALICEDQPLNVEIEQKLLEKKGLIVDVAIDGQKGLEKFSSSKHNYYDIILMDIRMPNMDGLEATKEIRKLDREDAKKVPIIAMTANAFSEDVSNCIEAGMNGHIAKPIDVDILYSTLINFMRKSKEGK